MQPIPVWLATALLDPIRITPRVEWSADWENWLPLRPLSGSHTQDRTSQTRWTFSGKFAKDYPIEPEQGGIHPYGCRARIFLDCHTLRNSAFSVPAGNYSVTSSDESDDNLGIDIAGASFETEVIDSDFVKPRNIPDRGGYNYRQQAEALITEAVADARFYWDPRVEYNTSVPKATFDSGRWAVVDGDDQSASLAGALGAEAYCDSSGAFKFSPVPRLTDAPVWQVGRGDVLSSIARGLDRENVRNLVAASGDSTDGATTAGPAYAWDDDPSSITYAGSDPIRNLNVDAGRYGVKPVSYSNSLIKNIYQAGRAANAQLANYLGFHYNLSFTARFNPAVEAGDVVAVEIQPGRWQPHLLDSITWSWGDATAACATRSPKEASV